MDFCLRNGTVVSRWDRKRGLSPEIKGTDYPRDQEYARGHEQEVAEQKPTFSFFNLLRFFSGRWIRCFEQCQGGVNKAEGVHGRELVLTR